MRFEAANEHLLKPNIKRKWNRCWKHRETEGERMKHIGLFLLGASLASAIRFRTSAQSRSCCTPRACWTSRPGKITDARRGAGARRTHRRGRLVRDASRRRADVIDLGDTTLMPGLIDAHVHLFLHPGAEDLQTVEESVPQRTIIATLAARDDLMAGFTAERDMGTEGAGAADTAVRNAINQGLIPGPRLRISGNAIDILGGHEDANRFNPEQHVLSNATYANNAAELVTVIREQFKLGADFIKIYETGRDSFVDGKFSTPYQYTEAELTAAVQEAARVGKRVAVHATGEPGTLYAARAGVVSIDHAYQLSDETMRMMREKQIFAVPTFTISEYFAEHAATPEQGDARSTRCWICTPSEFRKQLAAGVPMADGLRRRSVSARHAGARVRA